MSTQYSDVEGGGVVSYLLKRDLDLRDVILLLKFRLSWKERNMVTSVNISKGTPWNEQIIEICNTLKKQIKGTMIFRNCSSELYFETVFNC